MTYWILKGKIAYPTTDMAEWAENFESADRLVDVTYRDDYKVSTVFIALDHNFGGYGDPLVFETMTFEKTDELLPSGRPLLWKQADHGYMRYSTWADAYEGHWRIVEDLERSLAKAADKAEELLAPFTSPKPEDC